MRRRGVLLSLIVAGAAVAQPACDKPVYLTFDTGHMGVAPLIAETLKRHKAQATFFLSSEPTLTGGTTLDEQWAPWWRERVAEGMTLAATPGSTTSSCRTCLRPRPAGALQGAHAGWHPAT